MPHTLAEIFTHAHLPDFKIRNSWAGRGQRARVNRRVMCSRAQSAAALLKAAAETTLYGKEDLKAVHRVRHCKEVGLQEWSLAGRAVVLRVLYCISLCMSLRRRMILSKRLRAPARVALTIHTFRTVDKLQVVVLFAKRWESGDNRKVWKAFKFLGQDAPPRSSCSWGAAEAKRCMPQTSPPGAFD